MKKQGYIILIVLLVVAASAAIILLYPNRLPILKKEYVVVKEGSIRTAVTANGELVAKNFFPVTASAAFKAKAGDIESLRIKSIVPEGKVVRAGEEIAQLDRASIIAAVEKVAQEAISLKDQSRKTLLDTASQLRDLRFNLSNLKINMEIAQINMEQSLYDPPAAQRKTKLEFQKAKIAYEQAQQTYATRREQMESSAFGLNQRADVALKRQQELQRLVGLTSIKAPRSGVLYYYSELTGAKRGVGSSISPYDLTVAVIPDASSLYMECFLNEEDAAKIGIGQKAEVTLTMRENQAYSGRVAEVGGIPEIQNGKKMYRVMIRVLAPASAAIRPQMSGSASILLAEHPMSLYLPSSVVFEENGKSYVFTKDLRKQEVEVEQHGGSDVIIRRGLAKGEEVFPEKPLAESNFKIVNL